MTRIATADRSPWVMGSGSLTLMLMLASACRARGEGVAGRRLPDRRGPVPRLLHSAAQLVAGASPPSRQALPTAPSEGQHPAHQRAPGDRADDAVYGHRGDVRV
jgi:hypothetical protein